MLVRSEWCRSWQVVQVVCHLQEGWDGVGACCCDVELVCEQFCSVSVEPVCCTLVHTCVDGTAVIFVPGVVSIFTASSHKLHQCTWQGFVGRLYGVL